MKQPVTEHRVLQWALSYGMSIHKARRLTEEEKAEYTGWFKDFGFISLGEVIELEPDWYYNDEFVNQIRNREVDGAFRGCSNHAWIITEDEADEIIARSTAAKTKRIASEKTKRIEILKAKIAKCEQQQAASKLYSDDEAAIEFKRYNDLYNEGGYGFVPHFWTVGEYERMKTELKELEADAKITP